MNILLLSFLTVVMLIGLFTGIQTFVSPNDLFGTTNNMPWGLLISTYAFFVSSIGCCFVGSLGSVFKIKKFEPIEKKAIFLALLIVLVGMAIIFVELGQPFRMFIGYITGPNLTSPIWWMGVNYTLYLIFVTLEFVFLLKGNARLTQMVGIFALLAAVAAHSTVGAVFGVNAARPFWFGPYLPIDFIVCAWILGFSLMIIATRIFAQEHSSLIMDMGKWLALFLAVNAFFVFWKIITGIHSGEEAKALAIISLISGPLALRFWLGEIIIGIVIPFVLLMRPKLNVFSIAALLATIGMFIDKMNVVEAGQIVPLNIKRTAVFSYIKYSPTTAEISIIAAAIAFVILVYSLAEKYSFANPTIVGKGKEA